jgi:hypothetical protein
MSAIGGAQAINKILRKETTIMNQQNNREANNQQSLIEDLAINNEQAAEVKGGPSEINSPRSTELSGAVWSGVYDR